MKRWTRWLGFGAGGVVTVALVGALAVYGLSQHALASAPSHPERLASPSAAELADADRQAHVLGCVGCHGEGLTGKTMIDDGKVAHLVAPNLTRVAAGASDEQLARAIRQGVGVDGRALLIMPSAEYASLDDGEVAALINFIRAQPVRGAASPARGVGPLGRFGIVAGKLPTAPQKVAAYSTREPVRLSAATEAGRHIASRVCSDCHGADLSGGEPIPDEAAPDLSIAGAYDLAAFTRLLRTGVPASGARLKLMGETARNELSHLNDREIGDLYAYLQARARR